ncbi:hypothetical protein Y032_0002g684 [Ancylostoma ceylanicum]|uniref:Uncharacterized protein n=1 Tax=Ancylostoma ceylanicum TaxID=53326 RepID=A0A016W2M5_9BILA|nr:hypothetical protein Y032_0002g684 [Ancylostoma ceylanicum]
MEVSNLFRLSSHKTVQLVQVVHVQVFMFFTSLVQKFRFEPEGLYPPEIKMQKSALRAPAPYKIRAIDRIAEPSLI